MTSAAEWAQALLGGLGAPASADNVAAVVLWQNHEGQAPRENNPLATTQSGFGGRSNNPVGVKTYPTAQDGLAATLHVLRGGRHGYDRIVAALRAGDARGALQAVTASSWCPACAGYRNLAGEWETFHQLGPTYVRAANREVAGPLSTPAESDDARHELGGSSSTRGGTQLAGWAPIQVPGIPFPVPNPFGGGGGGGVDLGAVVHALRWLADPSNWRRVGMGALGVALTIAGVVIVVRDSRVGQSIEKAATTAALAAA